MKLPTYRNEDDDTGLPIQKVGIRGVRAPIKLNTKEGGTVNVVGTFSVYCDLSEAFKGVSMSLMQRRLFESLAKHVSTEVLIDITQQLIEESEHQAKSAYVKVKFPYYIHVKSPKSNKEAPKVYDCALEVTNIEGKIRKYLTVTIQYIATCPCSLELARHLYRTTGKESGGHQQRGKVEITIEFDKRVWIEDIIQQIETSIKAIPYPIVRKEDEQHICYLARKYPLFVEEASRQIGLSLSTNEDILDFVAVCNHEESIHQSNAVAVIRKGADLQ